MLLALIWIDYAFIGLFIIFALFGLNRGFLGEVLALLIWSVAVWVGLNFSRELAVFLEPWAPNLPQRMGLAILSLCLLTLAIGSIIAFLLGDLIQISGLSIISRFLGMLVGAFRTVFVITLVVILAGTTHLPQESWWRESQLIIPFQQCAIWLRNHASSGIAEFVNYE